QSDHCRVRADDEVFDKEGEDRTHQSDRAGADRFGHDEKAHYRVYVLQEIALSRNGSFFHGSNYTACLKAEGEGFEPSRPRDLAVFETARFNHSRTLPCHAY